MLLLIVSDRIGWETHSSSTRNLLWRAGIPTRFSASFL
jgi:hypothetical protein